MERKVLIKGDWHTSSKDVKAILRRDLSEFDGMYIEGRENRADFDDMPEKYIIFLLGYFTLEVGYTIASIFRGVISSSGNDPREELLEQPIFTDETIDANLDEIFWMASSTTHKAGLAIAVLGFIWGFIAVGMDGTVLAIFPLPQTGLSIALLSPFLYTALVIIVGVGRDGKRDKYMATETIERASERGHEKIIVFCGDSHVSGISECFEDRGWAVERDYSDYWFRRAIRWFSSVR